MVYTGLLNYRSYIIFLVVSVVISIGIQLVLPFPYGLGVVIALFILFPLLWRKRYMSSLRGYGGDPGPGRGSGGFFGMNPNSGSVKYSCLVCNNKYKGGSCPRCGSKMKRADF